MKHFRVAIDFDGTLFEDTGSIDVSFERQQDLNVKPHASEVTKWLKECGYEILIFTCRPDYHRIYLETQLNKNNIIFDYILFYTKPRVDLYIDDKGYRFENWLDTKQWIYNQLYRLGKLTAKTQQPDTHFEHHLRLEKIKHLNIHQFSTILDVGCGDASMWRYLNYKGTLHGVEPDQHLRDEAKKTIPLVYENVSQAPITKYDCVTLLGLLEHIENDKLFLKQFSSVQEIYMTVPNGNSFHRYFGKHLGMLNSLEELQEHDLAIGHHRYYTFETFLALIKDFTKANNFSIKSFGTCNFKFTKNTEMIQYEDKYHALLATAKDLNLIGDNNKYGAEIYAHLEKL